jgi:tRNA dimethylallyltransferase
MNGNSTRAIVVAGPTASGKSALALALGEQLGGTVINADSMQVYRELRVLTARPSAAEEARAPHRLYGVLSAHEPCSAGSWRRMALAAIDEARAAGRRPIVVGGTGLYLRALLRGIADVPPIPPAVRAEARARHAEIGAAAFHLELAALDPLLAARLNPNDTQRVTRAYEVIRATGQSLATFRAAPHRASGESWTVLLLAPPSASLDARIAERCTAMMRDGAVAEAAALLALDLDPLATLRKAVGVRELGALARGEVTEDAALQVFCTATRRYAKRQRTWFRSQIQSDWTISEQYSESMTPKIIKFIRNRD